MSFFTSSPSFFLSSVVHLLSSYSFISYQPLDSWCFIEHLSAFAFDCSVYDVLTYIILLSKDESLSDGTDFLWSESSWSLTISKSFNFSVTLYENFKSNNSEVWSTNASSCWFSLSFSGSSWSVKSSPLSEENSDSAVDQNTLFHGESLFIISSGNS